MRKLTLALLGAAAIVVLGAETASAQQFRICTMVGGVAQRNFQATIMSAVGSNTFSLVVIDTASVNAIGVGAMNINLNFLAPFTLSWNITADGVTEHFDCRLPFPQLSGLGNILTVTNTGNTRQQLSPCLIRTSPC